MAEARRDEQWNHTSTILAMLNNLWNKRKREPKHFHPMGKKKGGGSTGVTLQDFKDVLVGGGRKNQKPKGAQHERRKPRNRRSAGR